MNPDPKPKRKKAAISDKKLLAYWREAVLERAGHRCEYPECTVNYTQLHPHHFYTRSITSLRYDIDNGICLCPYHHTMGPYAAHRDPDFKDIIIERGVRSEAWHDKLIEKRNQRVKNTTAYKLECLEKLKVYL